MTRICEILGAAMDRRFEQDPHVFTRRKIELLRKEIARLEQQMTLEDAETTPD